MHETLEDQIDRLLTYPEATQSSVWGGIEKIDARARSRRNLSKVTRDERYGLMKIEAAAGRLLYYRHHRSYAFDTTETEKAFIAKIMLLPI